jgi:hypothetical protein
MWPFTVITSAAKQSSFLLAAQWRLAHDCNSARQSWIASSLRSQRKRFAFVAGNDGLLRSAVIASAAKQSSFFARGRNRPFASRL